jgi:hypothetical protein
MSTDIGKTPNPDLPSKKIKLLPEGINQADVDAVLKRFGRMKKRLYEDIVFMGGKLAKMKKVLRHGQWGPWVERTFPFSIRTATTWIQAWEGRDSELALNDPDAYMSLLWGNEPTKKLKAPKAASEREEDDEQSGGEGFTAGLGEPTFFADKGKPGFFGFKKLAGTLDKEFFESTAYTFEEKLEFINQLIKWLENKKKNLRP